MRFSLKKTFTWIFFTCVLFLVGFNLYNHKLWEHTYNHSSGGGNDAGYSSNNPRHHPWGIVKNIISRRELGKDSGPSITSMAPLPAESKPKQKATQQKKQKLEQKKQQQKKQKEPNKQKQNFKKSTSEIIAMRKAINGTRLKQKLSVTLGRDEKPLATGTLKIWPEDDPDDDRIVAQLKYIPPNYPLSSKVGVKPPNDNIPVAGDAVKKMNSDNGQNIKANRTSPAQKPKTIVLYNGFGVAQVKRGREIFVENKCQVSNCFLTDDRARMVDADAALFHHAAITASGPRPKNQIWILYMLECPYHTPGLSSVKNVFNWTATYRRDSTIVAPYEKFRFFNASQPQKKQTKNYAKQKTKKVAWFVSNCGAQNRRREYADELSNHIPVDIYGACGPLKCPRHVSDRCFEMLNKDYKFYLAFENSNCRDYITEKFFVNGLQHDVIPIVMGAHPDDYRKVAPPHSFIHVDDFESPAALAAYLHKLDQNDDLYNEYFKWKGTGEFINTFFWCRVCAMIHAADNHKPSWYEDIDTWWRGDGVCIGKESWTHKNSKRVVKKQPT